MALPPSVAAISFVGLYALSCLLLIPAGALTIIAGVAFGVPLGAALVVLGAVLGGSAAFVASRWLGREYVARLLHRHRYLWAWERALSEGGWRVVALIRLCPLIPFRFSNYLLGSTALHFSDFLVGTALGVVPSATFYVYLGWLAGGLGSRSSSEWRVLLIATVVSIFPLSVLVSYLQRRVRLLIAGSQPNDSS